MSATYDLNERPDYDDVLQQIADYALDYRIESEEAWETARYCLMDTLGCGLLALRFPECTKHLGPLVEGTIVPHGARVPGTPYRLDPVKAAWDIGCIVRWLDYNDTWLAAEWGHPSDNLGAILAVADHLSQKRVANGQAPLAMKAVLEAMILAHEIQGVLALENSFNRVRVGSCCAGEGGVDGRQCQTDGRQPGTDALRAVSCLGRWPGPAHLSPRAQRRIP